VAGDEVYGADPTLRRTVRQLGLGYVLAVAANRQVPTPAGAIRVDDLAALTPSQASPPTPADPAAKATATTHGPRWRCSPNPATRPKPTSTVATTC